MTPNKENITKWVDALRSGQYSQTKGCLQDRHGYCCLGVACEVFRLSTNSQAKWIQDDEDAEKKFMGKAVSMPDAVHNWLGLADSYVDIDDQKVSFEGLNDFYAVSFHRIADIIEKNYL